jgi:hypothetical protein
MPCFVSSRPGRIGHVVQGARRRDRPWPWVGYRCFLSGWLSMFVRQAVLSAQIPQHEPTRFQTEGWAHISTALRNAPVSRKVLRSCSCPFKSHVVAWSACAQLANRVPSSAPRCAVLCTRVLTARCFSGLQLQSTGGTSWMLWATNTCKIARVHKGRGRMAPPSASVL